MTRRYELSDSQFELIKDLLPTNDPHHSGHPWSDHHRMLNGMFWVLYSGAQWREMPERYGHWNSVYCRFRRWQKDGTIEKMLQRLHLKLDEEGYIDQDLWCVDATLIRASRSAAGASGKKNQLRA